MIDHSKCTHTRDRAGRSACRAGRAQPAAQTDTQVIDAIRTSERLAITQTAILAAADRIFPNPAAIRGKIRRTPVRIMTEIAAELIDTGEVMDDNLNFDLITLHNEVARKIAAL